MTIWSLFCEFCEWKIDQSPVLGVTEMIRDDYYNLEIKIKYTDIQFYPIFLSKKKEYYYHAQVDFDFGQVHIVWWLSYCQVEEKISVEPW